MVRKTIEEQMGIKPKEVLVLSDEQVEEIRSELANFRPEDLIIETGEEDYGLPPGASQRLM